MGPIFSFLSLICIVISVNLLNNACNPPLKWPEKSQMLQLCFQSLLETMSSSVLNLCTSGQHTCYVKLEIKLWRCDDLPGPEHAIPSSGADLVEVKLTEKTLERKIYMHERIHFLKLCSKLSVKLTSGNDKNQDILGNLGGQVDWVSNSQCQLRLWS